MLAAIDTRKLARRLARKRRPAQTRTASELEARLELLERDFYELGGMARDSYLRRREGILRRLEAARAAEAHEDIDLPREPALHLSERWPELSIEGRRRTIQAVLKGVPIERARSHGPIDPARVEVNWR